MKTTIINKLVCLDCNSGSFDTVVFTPGEDGEDINDGLLVSVCGTVYPVIAGVLRMLPQQLTSLLETTYPWYFERYSEELATARQTEMEPTQLEQNSDVIRIARSFGYEWNEFADLRPEYERNFEHYFESFPKAYFEDKLILDAGCGTGRHSYYAADYGAEVIGVDLSSAIDVAYRNNRNHPSTHFIQADLTDLPFRPGTFDLVYSIGVIDHVPVPEEGFQSLVQVVKPGGDICVYVHWKLDWAPRWHRALLALVTSARRFTTRMPHPVLKRVSWAVAGVWFPLFVLPARFLERIGLSSLANRIPLHPYTKSPFYALYKDTFDRLSAPIENRYSQADIEGWFDRARISDLRMLGGTGWRASGSKAVQTTMAAPGV